MKLGYFGSPDLSADLLAALLADSRHQVQFVVSNPDKPRGRSGTPRPTEVAELALERGLPLFRFPTLKSPEAAGALAAFETDLYVVFAYGRLLPSAVFRYPPRGAINLHASLLPALRGASPLQTALLEGYERTGWSVQFLTEELDAGDVIATAESPVDPDETLAELSARLLPAGIALTLDTLARFDELAMQARPQDSSRATYCKKITPAMTFIDWRASALRIHNHVRGLSPAPAARTRLNGSLVKLLRTRRLTAEEVAADAALAALGTGMALRGPGSKSLRIRCGEGGLEALELQLEGKKAQNARDFWNGYRGPEPLVFESTGAG